MASPEIPILQPTPGAGSADPSVTDQLALNDHLWLEQFNRYREIVNYLNRVKAWKETSLQQVGKGGMLPAPIPPDGYVLPAEAPAPPPPAPSFEPRVEEKANGVYPGRGDINPAGTVIANPFQPGKTLTKVQQYSPFSTKGDVSTYVQYWIDTP